MRSESWLRLSKIAGLSFGGIMLTLFGIPLVIFYLGVMYYSLR